MLTHRYYLLLSDADARTRFIATLKAQGVHAVFHYAPLHSALMGRRHGRVSRSLEATHDLADRLVRLPLWVGLEEHFPGVIHKVIAAAA